MRFRKSAPRALIVVAALVIAGLTCGANTLFGSMTSAVERSQIDLMRAIIAFNLEGTATNALARAEMTAADPLVRKLLAAQDRPGLLAHTQAMFNEQRDKYGVDQVQFHLAPATSFLRLQNPVLFSDDLSRYRPVVVAVNREHVARKGIEIARTGPAIFGVAPIRDLDSNHVGSVEFGMDFGALLDRLKAAYGLELTLFIDEVPLRSFANGIRPGVITEQNRVGQTMRLQSTNWTLMSQLVNGEDLRIHDEPRDWVRKAGGIPYGVVLQPLRNSPGETLGAIVIARSFEATRGAAGRTTVLQWLFALFGFLLVAGTILIVIRGWLVRPLEAISARFASVGRGERPKEDEDDRFLSAEMAALAAEHRRIADLIDGTTR
ncbi:MULTISPECIES: cache domain-containing protein [Rhodomicrobium]|uniref:cache domain-containing protein n=1 Tax=Rhodomicrobium TaxID=1068 RepID=UPI000B4BF683|nr:MULTISPECIES: cache domain-containing protein [Rhodomicrobium]